MPANSLEGARSVGAVKLCHFTAGNGSEGTTILRSCYGGNISWVREKMRAKVIYKDRVSETTFLMRLIVTGGAGFAGSAVCRHLIAHTDAEVINVDKLTYAGNLESLRGASSSPSYRFVKADIYDEAAMKSLFAQIFSRRSCISLPKVTSIVLS
jgi:NAD-dependent epimerase/dehydratase family protein